MQFDLFISHASEDKSDLVRPLADALRALNYLIWYDEFELKLGDSLSGSIDYGLSNSKAGVLVVSPSFIAKKWPRRELAGLATRHIHQQTRLIPIWHKVDVEDVIALSPPLADLKAANSSLGIPRIVQAIQDVVTPSGRHPSDGSIEMALDYLERNQNDLAAWAAMKALDQRLLALAEAFADRLPYAPTGAMSALTALLESGLLRTNDNTGAIDLEPIQSRFGRFESFGQPDPEEQAVFTVQVRRLLRANPILGSAEA